MTPADYRQQGVASLREVLIEAHANLLQAGEWVHAINICDARTVTTQIADARVLVKAAIDGLGEAK
jgi:hypothetical protein